MNIYRPTWLYVKQHNITGLKYFGKTINSDPVKYKGSGKYWKLHLQKHGNDVSTVWCQLFYTYEELYEYSYKFSIDNNIVNSNEWANLIPENGIGGGGLKGKPGRKWTEEEKLNHSIRCAEIGKGIPKKPFTEEHKMNISKSKKGAKTKPCSEETKSKIRSKNRLSIDTFISRAIDIHNNKYSYEHVSYKNAHTKITIVCPIHGPWLQRPLDHLAGCGCPKCGIEKRRSPISKNNSTAC